jgi:hypothetical protein
MVAFGAPGGHRNNPVTAALLRGPAAANRRRAHLTRADGSGWAAMVIVVTGSGLVLWVWSRSGLKESKHGEHAAAAVWRFGYA